MNGVTGRMGTNQHLVRSILALREQGGLPLKNGNHLYPVPILVGRNENKLRRLSSAYHLEHYTTDLDTALSEKSNQIYFDSQLTTMRAEGVHRAIKAGKHIYCEKPTGTTAAEALELYTAADGRPRPSRQSPTDEQRDRPGATCCHFRPLQPSRPRAPPQPTTIRRK